MHVHYVFAMHTHTYLAACSSMHFVLHCMVYSSFLVFLITSFPPRNPLPSFLPLSLSISSSLSLLPMHSNSFSDRLLQPTCKNSHSASIALLTSPSYSRALTSTQHLSNTPDILTWPSQFPSQPLFTYSVVRYNPNYYLHMICTPRLLTAPMSHLSIPLLHAHYLHHIISSFYSAHLELICCLVCCSTLATTSSQCYLLPLVCPDAMEKREERNERRRVKKIWQHFRNRVVQRRGDPVCKFYKERTFIQIRRWLADWLKWN